MYAIRSYYEFDVTMILNGALGGLVAVTAGPDLYNFHIPILIGAIGGALVVFAVPLFDKLSVITSYSIHYTKLYESEDHQTLPQC